MPCVTSAKFTLGLPIQNVQCQFLYNVNSILNSALFTSNLLLLLLCRCILCIENLVVLLPPFNQWSSVKPLEGAGRNICPISGVHEQYFPICTHQIHLMTFGTDADTNFRE